VRQREISAQFAASIRTLKLNLDRFRELAGKYARLRIAVVGDFCLDRYLEIDASKKETSIETGLPVHNIVRLRAQPGGAGTILNNLEALGVGIIYPLGFAGEDGEGFELRRALETRRGVRMNHFLTTDQRQTFTYCKPLLVSPHQAPKELSRLDTKNWTKTPEKVEGALIEHLRKVINEVDAMVVLDQVPLPDTGVVTARMIELLQGIGAANPDLVIIADSRRGLSRFRNVTLKMNAAELAALSGAQSELSLSQIKDATVSLALERKRRVFVTCAERGIVGANPDGEVELVPALPLRGEIDIVGAGDTVTANLVTSMMSGAGLLESLEVANAAASIVIHKLGTTGSASPHEIEQLLAPP